MVVEGHNPLEYRHKLETWLANPYALDEKWAERARTEVKEDPTTVRSNVETLRKMVEGEENLYARTDDLFLLAFLRGRKHNINEAFKLLKGYYHARANYPDYFQLCLPSEYPDLYNTNLITVLDEKDKMDRPVVYFKSDFDTAKMSGKRVAQMILITLDMLMMDPHVQIAGVAIVSNATGQSVSLMKFCSPSFLIVISRIFSSTFPLRLGCSICFNASFIFRNIWALFRPLLKEKLRKRTHVLGGDDLTQLHEHIPPDILPTEAGGMKPYCNDIYLERLGSIASYLQEWSQFGYNKAPRG